jgi:hypothetical protein
MDEETVPNASAENSRLEIDAVQRALPPPQETRNPRKRKNQRSNFMAEGAQLPSLWALFALLGAFAVSFTPSSNVTARLGLPIALMLAYLLIAYKRASFAATQILRTARIGQLADSLYFLGFLWTLWALIDSLVFKQKTARDAVFIIFGYALVTTAAGMFLRLLLLQFVYNIKEQSDLAEQAIENQIENFVVLVAAAAKAVESLAAGLDSVHMQTGNLIADLSKTQQQQLEQIRLAAESQFREFGEKLLQELDPSIRKLGISIAALADQVAISQNNLKNTTPETVNAMRTATNRCIETVSDSQAKIAEGISRVEKGAHAIISAAVTTQNSAQQATNSLNQLDARIRNIRVSSGVVESAVMQQTSQIFSQIRSAVATLNSSAQNMTITLGKLDNNLNRRHWAGRIINGFRKRP